MAKEINGAGTGKPAVGPSVKVGFVMKAFYALPLLVVAGMVGYFVWLHFAGHKPPVRVMPSTPFMKQPVDDLTANLFTESGGFRATGNDLFIEFRDARGKLTDVGTVEFDLTLSATNMVMHSIGKVFSTATPGQYRTTVEPQLAGDWKAKIRFEGPHGKGETNFTVSVRR